MADATAPQDEAPRKRSKLPLLAGLLGALLLGGAGFYASYSGLLGRVGEGASHDKGAEELPDIAFVAIEPMVLSLGTAEANRHLRFGAELEVPKAYQPEVALLLPRVLDVLNGYLRAVDIAELDGPSALVRIRAQMLRRVQIVVGEGRVRDLLITEFVLN
jgi:flagellar FliL protein